MEDRIAEIINLTKLLTDFGLKTNINIVCKNKKKVLKYKDSPVHFISQGISFEQSILIAVRVPSGPSLNPLISNVTLA